MIAGVFDFLNSVLVFFSKEKVFLVYTHIGIIRVIKTITVLCAYFEMFPCAKKFQAPCQNYSSEITTKCASKG